MITRHPTADERVSSGRLIAKVVATILLSWIWLVNSATAQQVREGTAGPTTEQACGQGQYRGFDSRLKVTFVGSVPAKSVIEGMEVMNGKVLVATPDALYSFDSGVHGPVRIAIADHLHRLMVSSDRRIWLETDKGYGYVTNSGIEMNNLLAALNGTGLTLTDSGEASFLAVAQNGETATLALLNPKGMLPLARVPGPIRTASWSTAGLAAVANNALFTWTPSSATLRIVARDKGLQTAQDVVLLPDNRVVVSLKNAVVLFSPKGHSIISGYGGRIRFSQGRMYVMDSNRALWAVEGIQALGDRQEDLRYANKLRDRQQSSRDAKLSSEAMRITGCETSVK